MTTGTRDNEMRMKSADPGVSDGLVTIRPIRTTDSVMEDEFIKHLSFEAKHYRFLGGVKELMPEELKRLCNVDGRESMAFVATVQKRGHEMEVGVSRYARGVREDVREIAITIADEWQHKGLGKQLLDRLIVYAKTHGVKELYSIELADNVAMRDLATEFGMSVSRDPQDANQVIYSLTL
jgi:GNAT superfamily N-acetyltransferase